MSAHDILEFGEFRVDPADQRLTRAGVAVKVPPRVFQTLVVLLEAYPRMVSKDELAKVLWPDTVVDESGLAQNVHLLRRAIGQQSDGSQYVETIPKRGYRFAASVQRTTGQAAGKRTARGAAALAAILICLGGAFLMRRPALNRQPNPDAVRLVRIANQIWENRQYATGEAGQDFRRAIELDPDYAPAYVGLANLLATGPPPATQAQTAIAQALRLDPNSSEAHATAGYIDMVHRWDWNEAGRELRTALALNSRNTDALRWHSLYLSLRGDHAAAEQELLNALRLDPQSAILLTSQCSELAFEGKLDSAIESCKAALVLQPGFHRAHVRLFQIYAVQGKADDAATHLALTGLPNDLAFQQTAGARVQAAAHRYGIQGLARDRFSNWGLSPGVARAEALALMGARDQALADLSRAVTGHEFLAIFIGVEPAFRAYHGDPVFESLLQRMGLPPSQSHAPRL